MLKDQALTPVLGLIGLTSGTLKTLSDLMNCTGETEHTTVRGVENVPLLERGWKSPSGVGLFNTQAKSLHHNQLLMHAEDKEIKEQHYFVLQVRAS